uniref:FAD-binding 8 domain-containing protein n=1 Tax=Fibrocapsa japonica TaxID=94617 RepID=A0A7S2V7M5_9STRA|mmetsp:Transcript_819/g.1189  ORF Transcript_819/g.1189 Transcript_819/m.1189 type:complete len:452 (+) Transcript_819:56-1411(+)
MAFDPLRGAYCWGQTIMKSFLHKTAVLINESVATVRLYPVMNALNFFVVAFGLFVTCFPESHPLHQEPRVTVQYNNSVEFLCVILSKTSAFAMYVPMISVFLTKCKALVNFARLTPFHLWLSMDSFDEHSFHVFCGKMISFSSTIHTVFHIIRWGLQRNLGLLISERTGVTGMFAVLFLMMVLLPMTLFRTSMDYEVRKMLHYLFFPFGISLACHAPSDVSFAAHVLSFCIILYSLDSFYVWMFMTEHIRTTSFHVLDCGVQLSMPVSDTVLKRYEVGRGGYVYVNIPWISKYEWHPFSVYDDPDGSNKRNIFIYRAGDWSKAVHDSLTVDTSRPVWLQGPFHSPFGSAVGFDNHILVATGIGITPAISTINALKEHKIMNLIWMTHDPELVEFYLAQHTLQDHSFNIIYYSGGLQGKRDIDEKILRQAKNVTIIKGFAQMENLIPQVIPV